MARKKRKKTRISFKRGSFRRKRKLNLSWLGPGLLRLSKIAAIAGFVIGIGLLLYYADKKYIRTNQSQETGKINLMKVPAWASQELIDKIIAIAGGTTFKLNDKSAGIVAENLKSAEWLENVSVQTTNHSLEVYASYRIPMAIINNDAGSFYVDADQVVLDYVPLPKLRLVEIKGVSMEPQTPRYGEVWKSGELAEALKIMKIIIKRDRDLPQNVKPLITEISSIDVSNYLGRKNRSQPHIILYSLDNTPIHWGAEIGQGQKYLESSDEQKLAKLYYYYEQEGTLSSKNKVKFINLRDQQDVIPLP